MNKKVYKIDIHFVSLQVKVTKSNFCENWVLLPHNVQCLTACLEKVTTSKNEEKIKYRAKIIPLVPNNILTPRKCKPSGCHTNPSVLSPKRLWRSSNASSVNLITIGLDTWPQSGGHVCYLLDTHAPA